jgi:hypothetical protein
MLTCKQWPPQCGKARNRRLDQAKMFPQSAGQLTLSGNSLSGLVPLRGFKNWDCDNDGIPSDDCMSVREFLTFSDLRITKPGRHESNSSMDSRGVGWLRQIHAAGIHDMDSCCAGKSFPLAALTVYDAVYYSTNAILGHAGQATKVGGFSVRQTDAPCIGQWSGFASSDELQPLLPLSLISFPCLRVAVLPVIIS